MLIVASVSNGFFAFLLEHFDRSISTWRFAFFFQSKMFRIKYCVLITIAFLVVAINCADHNDAFYKDVEDLMNHLPQHMEEALNLEEKQEQNRSFPLFSQCSRDFRRIFTSMLRKKIWAFKGTLCVFAYLLNGVWQIFSIQIFEKFAISSSHHHHHHHCFYFWLSIKKRHQIKRSRFMILYSIIAIDPGADQVFVD